MAEFNKTNYFKKRPTRSSSPGRRSESGEFSDRRNTGRRFNDRDSDSFERKSSRGSSFEREMHRVTCNKCGEKCEVPFKPSGSKPVYCNECFRSNENNPNTNRTDQRVDQNQNKSEFDQINQKLDKILKALQMD